MRRLFCACLLIAAGTASAADYVPELSLSVINDQLDMVQRGTPDPVSDNATGLGFGLALDGGGDQRFSLEYASFDLNDSRQLRLLDASADQFFRFPSTPPALRFFAGASFGYGRLDVPAEAGQGADHAGAAVLGPRLGLSWQFQPRLALELGARYLYTGLTTHPAAASGNPEFAVHADTSLWLGLIYRLR